jgi:hypothetical protein
MMFKNNLLDGFRAGVGQPSTGPKTGFAYLAELLALKRAELAQQA